MTWTERTGTTTTWNTPSEVNTSWNARTQPDTNELWEIPTPIWIENFLIWQQGTNTPTWLTR